MKAKLIRFLVKQKWYWLALKIDPDETVAAMCENLFINIEDINYEELLKCG